METARQTSPESGRSGKPPVDVAPARRRCAAATRAPRLRHPRRRRASWSLVGIGGYRMLTAGRESTDDAQVTADVVPVATRVGGRRRAACTSTRTSW